jgi:hypothetical protein
MDCRCLGKKTLIFFLAESFMFLGSSFISRKKEKKKLNKKGRVELMVHEM